MFHSKYSIEIGFNMIIMFKKLYLCTELCWMRAEADASAHIQQSSVQKDLMNTD